MYKENFIVTGARRNSAEFSMDNLSSCYQAVVCHVDFENEKITRTYIEKVPDNEIYPAAYTLSFRGFVIQEGIITTCTHSEIVEVDVDTFKVRNRITSSYFNDLHHVTRLGGTMWYASTGLDRVGQFVGNKEILHPVVSVEECQQEECRQIESNVDYRKISTKPHLSHPNYIFEVGNNVWVTRFEQKDAICLAEPEKKMNIEVERPHDGVVVEGKVYFTTVNGSIVVFDTKTLERIEVHDLQALYRQPRIGWCRGIEVIGDYAYVGFTRLRKTRSIENLGFVTDKWVNFKESIKNTQPARIVKYDLKRKRIVKEMRLNNSEMGVLFSLKNFQV